MADPIEVLSNWIRSNNHPLSHGSVRTLTDALNSCGLKLVPIVDECGLCGREWGESHREGCVAREIDGEYVL